MGAMAGIPLEDNFTDILGKAQRGLALGDAELARRAGVTAEELAARPPREDLAPDPALPADTRLWAALQEASGGPWGTEIAQAQLWGKPGGGAEGVVSPREILAPARKWYGFRHLCGAS